MYHIEYGRYSDMAGIVYKYVFFAYILLEFMLIKFDQILECVNKVPRFDFDSQTCI